MMLTLNYVGFVLKKRFIVQSNLCVKHYVFKMFYITRAFPCCTVRVQDWNPDGVVKGKAAPFTCLDGP